MYVHMDMGKFTVHCCLALAFPFPLSAPPFSLSARPRPAARAHFPAELEPSPG